MMNLPANDHAAEDIHHQVQAVELATHGGRQERNIPGPDLSRRRCRPRPRLVHDGMGLSTATPVCLPMRFEHSVEARLRGDIDASVCQPGHDLRRRSAEHTSELQYLMRI